MTQIFKVACVQTNTGSVVDQNLLQTKDLIKQAVSLGAELIILPELINVMDLKRKTLAEKTFFEERDPTLSQCCTLANKLEVYILIGSLALKSPVVDQKGFPKLANRSFFINPDGAVIAKYDKIHMFDSDISSAESYRESRAYEPGSAAVLAESPWGKLGMTICYDLRFPNLYRHLAVNGAKFFSIPAAFSRLTGRDHWHALVRARAIENGCYVFAAAQCGEHVDGRLTYGHSLIVNPWGEVMADGGSNVGIITSDIEIALVEKARLKVPSLHNNQHFV